MRSLSQVLSQAISPKYATGEGELHNGRDHGPVA